MMKKIYIAPKITVVVADYGNIMAGSPPPGVQANQALGNMDYDTGIKYGSTVNGNDNGYLPNAKENNNAWSTWDD